MVADRTPDVLADVDAFCRELRPVEELCYVEHRYNEQTIPLAAKHGITVLNAPGTIDSDYRGEIQVPLVNHGREAFVVTRGERIAQILFAQVPPVELVRVDELPDGERGDRGFGSTGRS